MDSKTVRQPNCPLRFPGIRFPGPFKEQRQEREELPKRGEEGFSVPDSNTSLSQQPASVFFNLMANGTGDQRAEPQEMA